jgi:hypothetical protein
VRVICAAQQRHDVRRAADRLAEVTAASACPPATASWATEFKHALRTLDQQVEHYITRARLSRAA